MKWMRRALPALLVVLSLAAAGCGSSKNAGSTATTPSGPEAVFPPARTPDQWAARVVDLFLRPVNSDLVVLNNYNNPQIRVYIATQNQETLNAIHRRLGDLKGCTDKLLVIGPPPQGRKLGQINDHFKGACRNYEQVANTLLEATDMLASGKTDVIERGERAVRSVREPSRKAAIELSAAIKIAQTLAPFRRAGLQPSV
jgi:hypothetical protein